MKKIAVIAVIAVLGIGGLSYALLKSNKQNLATDSNSTPTQSATTIEQPQPEALKVETVTVTYSDDGFSPNEVTIAKGSTVNFVNKSQMPLWVASDPHPEHTDYPEFDVMRARDQYPGMGEDFSFTFDKVGTWKYHSHTASGDGTEIGVHPGLIVVK